MENVVYKADSRRDRKYTLIIIEEKSFNFYVKNIESDFSDWFENGN